MIYIQTSTEYVSVVLSSMVYPFASGETVCMCWGYQWIYWTCGYGQTALGLVGT